MACRGRRTRRSPRRLRCRDETVSPLNALTRWPARALVIARRHAIRSSHAWPVGAGSGGSEARAAALFEASTSRLACTAHQDIHAPPDRPACDDLASLPAFSPGRISDSPTRPPFPCSPLLRFLPGYVSRHMSDTTATDGDAAMEAALEQIQYFVRAFTMPVVRVFSYLDASTLAI